MGWIISHLGRLVFWRDLLSRRVVRAMKPYKRILSRRKPWIERLSDTRWIALIFLLPSVFALIATASCIVFPSPVLDSDEWVKELLSVAKALGAILGSLSGILITVIIFALEIRRSDIPGGVPLLRIYATRRGYLPTVAFALGTIVSAVLVVSLGPYWHLASLERAIWTVSVFVICSVLLEFWLVFKTIHELGRETAKSLLTDYFKAQHRDSLEAEIRRRVGVNLFAEMVRSLGFHFNIFMRHGARQQYVTKKKGCILDIDFGPIRKLAARWALTPLPNQEDLAARTGVLGGENRRPPVFTVLPYQRLEERQPTVVLVTDADEKDPGAEAYLNKAFICGDGN